jgi:hypothetical protein
MEEDVPIEHRWVTQAVENAQKKVEERNFDIRKNLLEYDDVMNQQRKSVYSLRRQVLEGYRTVPTDDEAKKGALARREGRARGLREARRGRARADDQAARRPSKSGISRAWPRPTKKSSASRPRA